VRKDCSNFKIRFIISGSLTFANYSISLPPKSFFISLQFSLNYFKITKVILKFKILKYIEEKKPKNYKLIVPYETVLCKSKSRFKLYDSCVWHANMYGEGFGIFARQENVPLICNFFVCHLSLCAVCLLLQFS